MKDIVLASSNASKIAEMQSILGSFGFNVIPQSEFAITDAIEDGLSFIENAIIKARHACQHSGLPAIADDSGLEVDALNGAPGIYSARYAGEPSDDKNNNTKLLDKLKNTDNRTARFQCVIALMRHQTDPVPIIAQGTWQGEIATAEKGTNGFGYDPLFYVPQLACHSAELEPETKKRVSHRGRALAHLKTLLADI